MQVFPTWCFSGSDTRLRLGWMRPEAVPNFEHQGKTNFAEFRVRGQSFAARSWKNLFCARTRERHRGVECSDFI
jgi:hypothetical protein